VDSAMADGSFGGEAGARGGRDDQRRWDVLFSRPAAAGLLPQRTWHVRRLEWLQRHMLQRCVEITNPRAQNVVSGIRHPGDPGLGGCTTRKPSSTGSCAGSRSRAV